MNRAEVFREIHRLKSSLKRNNSLSDSSDEEPLRKKYRRLIISSDSSDIEDTQENVDENQVAVNDGSNDDILSLLGDDPTINLQFGEDIHSHIAVRWNNILRKGLNKDIRNEFLTKKHLPPSNCELIQPPKLNDEIKAAVQEASVKRANKLFEKQSQLGVGLTCIGRAINIAINIPHQKIRQDIFKHLQDGGQILTDLHYLESVTRRSLLLQGLNKTTKEAIRDIPRNTLLFEEDLPEKMKALKACTRSAVDLKSRPFKAPRGKQEPRPSASYLPGISLNWRGSSRAMRYSRITGSYREPHPAPPAPRRRPQVSLRPPQQTKQPY